MLIQAVMYLGIIAITRLARPSLTKLCYNRRAEKSISILHLMLKGLALWSIIAAYTVPFFLIPRTVHPVLGWSLYLLGSGALSSVVINAFVLPPLPVLTPWLGIFGSLAVMACPWYSDGVVRALSVFAYAFCCAPFVWVALMKVMASLQNLLEREAFFPRLGETTELPSKLYWNDANRGDEVLWWIQYYLLLLWSDSSNLKFILTISAIVWFHFISNITVIYYCNSIENLDGSDSGFFGPSWHSFGFDSREVVYHFFFLNSFPFHYLLISVYIYAYYKCFF